MADEKKGINLQLSTAQFAQAKHRAHQMEMTLTQYIRHLIWQDTVRVVADVKADAPQAGEMPNGIKIMGVYQEKPE